MRNVLLAGVGGQGTVLAAKLIAQAANDKGWHVRTAETIGMAQRGGSVVSHVRFAEEGRVASPLIPLGQADALIAFEPGEALRSLRFLKPEATVVAATRLVSPLMASLGQAPYVREDLLGSLRAACPQLVLVDAEDVLAEVGSAKALNVVLLASAVATIDLGISVDELKEAIRACVKPRFVEMNLRAVDLAVERALTGACALPSAGANR